MSADKTIADLTVGDICSTDVVTVDHFQTMAQVARIFGKHEITGAPVVDENEQCIGIVTSQDIVAFYDKLHQEQQKIGHFKTVEMIDGEGLHERSVIEVPHDLVGSHMSSAVQTITSCASVTRAAEIMCMEHIHRLVVLNDAGRPVGIVSSLDIVATLWNLKIFNELAGKLSGINESSN